jgi:Domain of unknown function (DUF4394)
MNRCFLSIAQRGFAAFIATLLAAISLNASAVLLYAYDFGGNRLLTFDSATPGTILSNIPISGLTRGEYLIGIDTRPATGALYGIATIGSGTVRLVTIDPRTGATTQVAATTLPSNSGLYYGMAFNPIPDRIRLVNNTAANLRFNPDTGALVASDTNLVYSSGDAGVNPPQVVHLAYTNAFLGATTTTLYGIDANANSLVRIGGIDGTPSPNGGLVTTIGPLGIDTAELGGFVISPKGNVAYAALNVGGVSVLSSINLETGAATAIGRIDGTESIDGLAFAPAVNECLDLDGDGVVSANTDGLMLLRALLGMTGSAVTSAALPTPTPPRSNWTAIRTHMNANCGFLFGP